MTYLSLEANTIDSLKLELENATSTINKIDLLNELSAEFNRTDLVRTKEYAQQALELAKSIDYKKGIADAYRSISSVETSFGNDLKAIEISEKALKLAEELKDDVLISTLTNDLGILYIYLNKYDLALASYQRSLSIANEINDIEGICYTNGNIGLIHLDLGNNTKAIEYFKAAYDVGIKSEYAYVRAAAYENKARIYSIQKDFKKAIEYEKKSLNISLEANDKLSASYSYMSIGYSYQELEEYKEAESHFKVALKYAIELGDKGIIGSIRTSLSDIYSKQGMFKEAIHHGEIAQAIYANFEQEDSTTWYLNHTLATAYAGVGEYAKAYELMKEYNEMSDSMISRENRQLIAKMEAEYRIAEKDAENEYLKKEQDKSNKLISQQRVITIISILLAIAVAIVAGLLYYNSIQRRKNIEVLEHKVSERTQKLESTNASLERFNYIASHDLKEPLRSISSFTDLLSRRLGTEDQVVLQYMDFIKRSSKRMYSLVGAMLEVSHYKRMIPNFQQIDTNKLVHEVTESLSKYIEEQKAIINIGHLPTVRTDEALLSIVFQNLITNGIKYNENETPEIKITAIQNDYESIFSIVDNGIGIKPEFREQIFEAFKRLHHFEKYSGTGVGLFISKDIIELHNGRIWIETNPKGGSIFRIALPK